jgi:hypothetical protein
LHFTFSKRDLIWEQKRKKHFRANLDEEDDTPPPRQDEERISKRDQVIEEKRRRRERQPELDEEYDRNSFEVRTREPEVPRRTSPSRRSFDPKLDGAERRNPFSPNVDVPIEKPAPRNEVNSAGGFLGGIGQYDRERKQGHKELFDPSIPKAPDQAPRNAQQQHHSADQNNRGGLFDNLGKNEHPNAKRMREAATILDPRKNDPIYNGGVGGGGGLFSGLGSNSQPHGGRRGRQNEVTEHQANQVYEQAKSKAELYRMELEQQMQEKKERQEAEKRKFEQDEMRYQRQMDQIQQEQKDQEQQAKRKKFIDNTPSDPRPRVDERTAPTNTGVTDNALRGALKVGDVDEADRRQDQLRKQQKFQEELQQQADDAKRRKREEVERQKVCT